MVGNLLIREGDKVICRETNHIHPQNFARIFARALANEENHSIYRIAFGNGGTYVDATGTVSFRTPNDGIAPDLTGIESRLYNETYSEIVDEQNPYVGTGPGAFPGGDGPNVGVRSSAIPNSTKAQVVVTAVLNSKEPALQGTSTVQTGLDSTDFIFDEIGLFSAGRPPIATQGTQDVLIGTKTSTDRTYLAVGTYSVPLTIDGIPKTVSVSVGPTETLMTYGELASKLNAVLPGAAVQVTQPGMTTNGNLRFVSLTSGANSSIVLTQIAPGHPEFSTWLFPNLKDAIGNSVYQGIDTSRIGVDGGEDENPANPALERERMLTHLIFHPLLKSADRTWTIEYTLTIDIQRTGGCSEDEVPAVTISTIAAVNLGQAITITGTTNQTAVNVVLSHNNETYSAQVNRVARTWMVIIPEDDVTMTGTFTATATAGTATATKRYVVNALPTYGITPSVGTVNEGGFVTFTVTTTGVPSGTVLQWATRGGVLASDFADSTLTGMVAIGGTGTGTFTRTLAEDLTTEGTETFTVAVFPRDSALQPFDMLAESTSVTISDTSTTPVPVYGITSNVTAVDEGETVTFAVTTANVPTGTVLYWSTLPSSGSSVTSADFADRVMSGTVTLDSTGNATIARTLAADLTTEGAESFAIVVRKNGTSGEIVATSSYVTINDTSTTTIPTYTITPSATSVNEGGTVTFAVTTTNVPAGVLLNWDTALNTMGNTDFVDQVTAGAVTLDSAGGATISRTLANDLTTEGAESFGITIYRAGLPVATSSYVTVNDTSTTPVPITIYPSSVTVAGRRLFQIAPSSVFTTTGFGGSVTYSITPALPAGLVFSTTTGVISGTPTVNGTTTHTITATGSTSGTKTVSAVVIVSELQPIITLGQNWFLGTVGDGNWTSLPLPTPVVGSFATQDAINTGSRLIVVGTNNYGSITEGAYYTDDGDNWTLAANSVPMIAVQGTATNLLGRTGGLFSERRFERSVDNGVTWTTVPIPTNEPLRPYAHVYVAGAGFVAAWLSEDTLTSQLRYSADGVTWADSTVNGVLSSSNTMLTVTPTAVYCWEYSNNPFAATSRRVSRDGGVTWTVAPILTLIEGLVPEPSRFAEFNGKLYASTSNGSTSPSLIYESADDGITWTLWETVPEAGYAFVRPVLTTFNDSLYIGRANAVRFSNNISGGVTKTTESGTDPSGTGFGRFVSFKRPT